jgi:hypothetical protein
MLSSSAVDCVATVTHVLCTSDDWMLRQASPADLMLQRRSEALRQQFPAAVHTFCPGASCCRTSCRAATALSSVRGFSLKRAPCAGRSGTITLQAHDSAINKLGFMRTGSTIQQCYSCVLLACLSRKQSCRALADGSWPIQDDDEPWVAQQGQLVVL